MSIKKVQHPPVSSLRGLPVCIHLWCRDRSDFRFRGVFAKLTSEWPLIAVNTHVNVQRPLRRAFEVADQASQLWRVMDPSVKVQLRTQFKC